MRPVLCVFILAALWIAGGSARAEGIYRWTDSSGEVHFSDRPPGAGARAIPAPDAPAPVTDDPDRAWHEERTRRLLRAFREERAEREAAAARARRTAEVRRRNCGIARDRLRTYRTASYLYTIDAQGKREVLSDAGRTRALEEARRAVRRWCGEAGGG